VSFYNYRDLHYCKLGLKGNKFDTYFTNFWTGFWNLWGLLLVILGYLFDESAQLQFLAWGWIAVGAIIFLLLVSFFVNKDNSNYIRIIGKSIVAIPVTVFFSLLFFSNEPISSGVIAVFYFISFVVISQIVNSRMKDARDNARTYSFGNYRHNYRSHRRFLLFMSVLNPIINLLVIYSTFTINLNLLASGLFILFLEMFLVGFFLRTLFN